ncbi:Rieske (2Fe-2S) protein [Streptomyces sp. TR1341]|uniref:Rieske 2Fe-2S domain-containing protein n=1 Tax=Streptomyces sp. TR1341 TaxID=2601266 RepID=UPI00138AF647|nr:Rieske (2Fe-2S) protein [Streptomyces sp. TR1341]
MTTHPTDAAAQQADGTPLRVARSEDVPERGRLILDVGGRSFALFRVGGRLYAYDNVCPHQGGPVCQGLITPRVTEPVEVDGTTRGLAFDESALHLVCPWHGFEFDLTTGRHPGRPQIGLRSLRVEERKGHIHVHL